jgi:hypothetical protein
MSHLLALRSGEHCRGEDLHTICTRSASLLPTPLGPAQNHGMGVVIFVSEDAATAAAQGPRRLPRDEDRAWNVEDVTIYEQVTSA